MVFPETRLSQVRDVRTVQHSCSYGTFKKLANDWFPHEMICFEDGHRDLGIKLTELSLEPSPDPALFTPPPGAIELANCRTVLTPPRAISTPQPLLASGSADQNRVAVEAVLDVKGKPQNVRVVASASETLDKNAVNAVREWRFKPATCDGEPVPYQMRVEVIFRFFR
jgi:TonB family protein